MPEADDRRIVHEVIYRELVRGEVRDASRARFRSVITGLVEHGAEAVILGCTELMLLVRPKDSPVPLYDTTTLHAEAAALRALQAEN